MSLQKLEDGQHRWASCCRICNLTRPKSAGMIAFGRLNPVPHPCSEKAQPYNVSSRLVLDWEACKDAGHSPHLPRGRDSRTHGKFTPCARGSTPDFGNWNAVWVTPPRVPELPDGFTSPWFLTNTPTGQQTLFWAGTELIVIYLKSLPPAVCSKSPWCGLWLLVESRHNLYLSQSMQRIDISWNRS